jgi:hypothetical protein
MVRNQRRHFRRGLAKIVPPGKCPGHPHPPPPRRDRLFPGFFALDQIMHMFGAASNEQAFFDQVLCVRSIVQTLT